MQANEPTVFVVDDDEALCEALQWLLESAGLRVEIYHSAEAFLDVYRPDRPGCLVLDVRLRGLSGLELQARLARDGITLPIIIITGHGSIPTAVRAVKAGAMEFFEKPVDDEMLVQRVRAALEWDGHVRRALQERYEIATRQASLSPREREVLEQVVLGKASKQIAAELGVTEKTVEVHRKHILHKMGVHSTVDLVRAVISAKKAGERPAP